MVSHVIVVALAAHFFDHCAEQNEAVIAVLPLAARLELERAAAVQLHIIVESAQLQAVCLKFRSKNIARAAGMREKVIDRHLRGEVFVGIIGQVSSHRIVEPELACPREL